MPLKICQSSARACTHKCRGGVVRFSNRPFGVKHFQTVRRCSVDVTHGLVLLFGIGTKAVPSWDSKTRWSNLLVGLAVRRTAGPSGHANSPHPSSREGHHSTAGWSSTFLLSRLILRGRHAAAASRVQRNSVPSTQMRCMIIKDADVVGVRLLGKPEVIAIANASFPTIWEWMRAGKFPRARIVGGRSMWRSDDIDKWLAELPVRALKGDPSKAA